MFRARKERPCEDPLPQTLIELISSLLGTDVLADASKTRRLVLLLCAPPLSILAVIVVLVTGLAYLRVHPHVWIAGGGTTVVAATITVIVNRLRRIGNREQSPVDPYTAGPPESEGPGNGQPGPGGPATGPNSRSRRLPGRRNRHHRPTVSSAGPAIQTQGAPGSPDGS